MKSLPNAKLSTTLDKKLAPCATPIHRERRRGAFTSKSMLCLAAMAGEKQRQEQQNRFPIQQQLKYLKCCVRHSVYVVLQALGEPFKMDSSGFTLKELTILNRVQRPSL